MWSVSWGLNNEVWSGVKMLQFGLEYVLKTKFWTLNIDYFYYYY